MSLPHSSPSQPSPSEAAPPNDDVLRPFPAMNPYGGTEQLPEGIPAKVRRTGLKALRRWGELTARWRADPDYIIIGTKRGGSTSMARWILEHPQVKPLFPSRETRKGTYFFDVNYHRGKAWYRSHFPSRIAMSISQRLAGKRLVVGEATPYYLYHPHAPVRARRHAPKAKIICLLRDPAARTFGHWGERTRNGVEWLDFPAAIAAETVRLDGEEAKMIADPGYNSFPHQHFSYVDQSRYDRGLQRWMDAWPKDQLLVIRSEDMYEDPESSYVEVLSFLGLDDYKPQDFAAWNNKSTTSIPEALETEIRELTADSVAEVERLLDRNMGWG